MDKLSSRGEGQSVGGAERHGLLGRILDRLPLGIVIADADGAETYANEAGHRHATAPERQRLSGEPVGHAHPVEWLRQTVAIDDQRFNVTLSSDASAQKKLEDELFRQAYFDDLTGLPNRRLIETNVSNLIESSNEATVFGLAFIDIDNFKHINDYYGHDVGDRLLVKIAERFGATLRPTDMLARVGGDELLLLLSPLDDARTVTETVTDLIEGLQAPFFIDGHEIFSSASVGVSLFPLHGRTYSTLRVNADTAMYRIKGGTKGGMKIFDPQIGHAATERMKVEQRLRTAIRDRRLCCAFQPKVDFRSDHVTGVEVLLRWRDEEGVIHAPGDFVGLAVELGLMDDITLTVLEETVRTLPLIDEDFGPDASVSINVAAKQATDMRFMRQLADALSATGQPERFMVELTEEAFLSKTQFQSRVLPMLREIGTRVSIDDFGVGFSSLSALADITADELKVDRSFITAIHQRPRSQSILAAIESLGRALGMKVVVEGVETFEELAYLQGATQIRVAQGYYFHKPFLFDETRSAATAQPRYSAITRGPTANRQGRSRIA